MKKKELEKSRQTGIEMDEMDDWFGMSMKDAKKKMGIIVEGLEEISKIRAKEYLGCNNIVSDEKKINFVKFVKFVGEMKDVLNR